MEKETNTSLDTTASTNMKRLQLLPGKVSPDGHLPEAVHFGLDELFPVWAADGHLVQAVHVVLQLPVLLPATHAQRKNKNKTI